MTYINVRLPLADALRITNVLVNTTDKHFLDNNRAHTPDHRNTITAEQRFYTQIHEQVSEADLRRARQEMSPAEARECIL